MTLPLPDELTGLAFSYLDVLSLVRCMQVCKLFHSIISGSTQLVYKIELFASFMEDGEPSHFDTVDRLHALREHNRVWNDMKWMSSGSIEMRDGQCWEYSGGILAQSTAQDEIFFVQLPCTIKGITEHQWTVPFGFRIRDFTLDNSQDLLVLLELAVNAPNVSFTLHTRTLSGEPHPRAAVSQIAHTLESMHEEFSILMQICGSHFAVLFYDQLGAEVPNSFLVWNWQTGQHKVLIRMPKFHSFAFMTEELILAAILRSDKEPCLHVLNIGALRDPVLSLDDMPYVCELRLPALKGRTEYFLIRSEPTPTWRAPANIPFYRSRMDFIFTISLRVITNADVYENTVFFVPLSTLLLQVERSRGVTRRSVTWSDWGPHGSRMIAREPSETWVCYTYGMKFIQGLRWKNGQEARVYDFNPYAARHCIKTSADSSIPWMRLAPRTKMNARFQGFDEEVTTTLPGRVVTLKLDSSEDGWDSAMIGEDNILMVQPESGKYGYMAM